MMIEQPLAHDEIIDHADLQAQLDTPICLDECIRTAHQAEQAIRMKACGIINIKLGRVGGFREAKRVHDVAQAHGIPVWCGGMLESGIGRAHNIALSTLPNFVLPGDVSASKRYWTRDIISPAVEVSSQGTIAVPPTSPASATKSITIFCRHVTVREETLAQLRRVRTTSSSCCAPTAITATRGPVRWSAKSATISTTSPSSAWRWRTPDPGLVVAGICSLARFRRSWPVPSPASCSIAWTGGES